MTDKIFTYVTCRRGYRAGGINTPGFSAVLAPFQYFGPQKVNDVEIGAKTQWSVRNVRGRFNIAAFRGVFSSLQRQIDGIPLNIEGDNEIGRAHVGTPVTKAHIVSRLLHEKTKTEATAHTYIMMTSSQTYR